MPLLKLGVLSESCNASFAASYGDKALSWVSVVVSTPPWFSLSLSAHSVPRE